MAEWFEDWFNSEEYLFVYRHRNEEDAQNLFNLIIKNTSLENSSKVLDLACGAGRHSILFAKNNFIVTGIDISENLLCAARRTAAELGLQINFIKADLRNINLTDKFHLVINLFTSFGYFETDAENEKMISLAYNCLLDNGYFILDFFNIVYLRDNLIPISYDLINDGIIKQERTIQGNRIIKKISIHRNNSVKYYKESVRAYCKDELVSMISRNKFNIVRIFGSYNAEIFDEHSSPRVIIIAQK